MLPLLAITFNQKLQKIMSDAPRFVFDLRTGEEKIFQQKESNPSVKGYSPGGVIFPVGYVYKVDEETNTIYLRSCWQLKIVGGSIKIWYSGIRKGKIRRIMNFDISERVVQKITIIYPKEQGAS